ncbi:hypothetical protein [Paenibacillus elgii]|uniref:hypothetical protein n=1 Tax=Paenibacillus elgii TaxID=189691 RepID=UPI001111B30B|nr:hypothetical protein [Paenibacillus elgii]
MKKIGLLLCVHSTVLAEGTIQVRVNQSLLGTEAQAQNERRHGYGCCPAFGGGAWSAGQLG